MFLLVFTSFLVVLQHNMSTAIDKEAIKEAYIEVMADNNGIEW